MTPAGIEMVPVAKGVFWMGGGGGKVGDREVEITESFYMGVYPVTKGQWQAIMGKHPGWFSRTGGGKGKVKHISDEELAEFPVESVSLDDAKEFVARLNEKERGNGWEYRLPTEEEWEYTARGGHRIQSKEDCAYHFYLDHPTNDLSSTQANCNGSYPSGNGSPGSYLGRTSKVGSYPANSLGIHDLHGNVWEWTDSPGGDPRKLRGGCWLDFAGYCRCGYRIGYVPVHRDPGVGLRLVAQIKGEEA